MMISIRKRFFFLVFLVAIVGVAIYIYEIPNNTENHLHLHEHDEETKTEIPERKYWKENHNKKLRSKIDHVKNLFSQKNDDRDRNIKSGKETERRNIISKTDSPSERTFLPGNKEKLPKRVRQNGATEKAKMDKINQTLWDWLNTVKAPEQPKDGASRSLDYCRPVEQIINGAEGQTVSGFTLEHVHVIIRHGDRSPIYSLPRYGSGSSRLDCYMNYSNIPDKKIFRNYLSYMKTVWEVLSPDTNGARFGLYPRNKKCEGAQLTPKGVVQHLKNGEHLRKIYVNKLRLFGRDDIYSKLIVKTTDYTRTYQSALAFAYGFIPEFDYFKLKLRFSRGTNFCSRQLSQMRCECKVLHKLQSIVEEEYSNQSRSSRLHNEIKQELAEIFHVETGRLPWIAAAMDVVMGHYCHDKPLPCFRDAKDKSCITIDLVRRIWKFLDDHGHTSLSSYANVKFSRLTMQPLLTEIYNRMYNVTRGTEKTKFYLYSGHDVTIAQLITCLGIHDGVWPPYASRLIFELYSGIQERTKYYYLRVIYNGKDLTHKLIFCKRKPIPHALCPIEYFKNFVKFESLKPYGSTDYNTVCRG